MIVNLSAFFILFVGFMGACIVAYLIYCDIDKKKTTLKRRISDGTVYGLSNEEFQLYYLVQSQSKKKKSSKKSYNFFNFSDKITLLLQRADVKIDAQILAMVVLGIFVLVLSIFILEHKSIFIGTIIAISSAVILPYKTLTYLGDKRRIKFDKSFVESLDIMVRSIKAGFSVNRSISLVAEEARDPVKTEFQIISEKLKAGQPLDVVLYQTCERINLDNLRFFAVCILIQSETGGNLSDALTNLIHVIRKRQEISMKIKALSSEARASAVIVGSLPFLAGLALSIFNPSHMAIFYHTPSGQRWIMIMFGLLTTGILVIRKLIRFEI